QLPERREFFPPHQLGLRRSQLGRPLLDAQPELHLGCDFGRDVAPGAAIAFERALAVEHGPAADADMPDLAVAARALEPEILKRAARREILFVRDQLRFGDAENMARGDEL